MPKNHKPRVPSYRPHSSGQARVSIAGKDYLLGTFGTPQSKEEYNRIIAEWLTGTGRFAPLQEEEEPISVNELALAYYRHAEAYYGWDEEPRRGDAQCYRDAIRIVKNLFGMSPARDFGPRALKLCREEMLRKDWSRTYINSQVGKIQRMFRWGVEEEMISPSVWEGLRSVTSLKRGKCEARETGKVKPVEQDRIDATLPFMPAIVADMVRFQLATGCRPAEVCMLRPCDLDTSDPSCWVYRPRRHKTEHHDHERLILIGPRGQLILRPYLGTKLDAPCFSPAKSEEMRSEERRTNRKTPLWESHLKAQAKKKPAKRKRPPGDAYTTTTYRKAINRACDLAFPPEGDLARKEKETHAKWKARMTPEQHVEVKRWRKAHRWSPNRLRHNRATELRKHGLDLAKTVLGHSRVETTLVYAEKDLQAAKQLIARIG
jgi:integrase